MNVVIMLGMTILVGAALGLAILHLVHAILIRGIGATPPFDNAAAHESGRQRTN